MSSFNAIEENAKLVGRYVLKDGVTWLVQSGSSAELIVAGRSAELVLTGDRSIDSEREYRPRYAVYVDDELIADNTADKPEKVIMLFSGASTVTKKVTVMMLSEAEYGAVGIGAINVDSDENDPVRPAHEKNLSIEFIGDSITCAYGVEGSDENDPFRTSTENFTKSYAYLTAQKLNADCSAVCYSGHGIISGYTSSGIKDTKRLVPAFYDMASKLPDYSVKWDHDRHRNDIVVVNLGTNDSSFITAEDRMYFSERIEEFMKGYVEFLKAVRSKNSASYIICTFGTMDSDNICEYVEKAVADYKKETKDSRIAFCRAQLQSASDGYGCDWHPSEITHKKLSELLAAKISGVLAVV